MKKTLLIIMSVIMFSSAWAYDFSYTHSGITLYYNITSSVNHTVAVTCPNSTNWSGYSEPTGSINIPSSFTYGGIIYTVTSIGYSAFHNCSGLTSVTIPNSISSIENHAFNGCNGLTSITIPNSVTSFGESAFWNCSGLTSVTIPNSVILIGDNAFGSCSGLTSVTIPNSVNSIGNSAFYHCSGLTSTTIPNSVTSIGSYAFQNCSGLTSITLGTGVSNIGLMTFHGCSQLDTVRCYANNPPSISGNYTTFGFCGHTVNTLFVRCESQSQYSSWSNYFNHINCINFYTLTALSNNTSYGSVTGSGSYASGSYATLTATANNDYHFARWDDNNICNPRTVQVNSNATYTAFFASNNCTISVNSNNTNWGIVTGGGNYDFGSTATITATPHSHYHFDHWNDNDTTNPRNLTVSGDTTLTAIFAIDQHSVTVTSNNNNWGSVSGGGNYDYGSTTTLTAIPVENHCYFVGWDDGYSNPTRTISVLSDTVFGAEFGSEQYSVIATCENATMGHVTGSGTFDYYGIATLQATANYGYHFVRWSDNIISNPRSLTVVSDTVITAMFARNQYHVSVNSGDPEWGAVSGAGYFEYGSQVTITATPLNNHYYFSRWDDGNTEATRTITLLSDTLFTAYFGINQYTVTATSANPEMGFVTGDGVYDYNSTATITAVPYSGYQFLHWNDGYTDACRSITMVQDVELTAYFGKKQGIDNLLSPNPDSHLTIYPNPAQETVTLQMPTINGEISITITDIQGRIVMFKNSNEKTCSFSVANWSQGIYFVKALFPDKTYDVKKLIVK